MKIFLRSPNWIGDCIMSIPSVRALKQMIPDCEIFIICSSHLSSIYKNISEVSKIVEIPHQKKLSTFLISIRILRKYKIKEGILLTNSFQSALVLRLAGVRNLTGYSKDLRGWLLRRKQKFNGKRVHQIKSYLNLIELYLNHDIPNVFSNRLVISDEEKESALKILIEKGWSENTRMIGLSPAAAYGPTKEWPVNNFIELIKVVSGSIGHLVFVVFGSEKDEEKIRKITNSLTAPVIVIGGDYSLREAITIISLCDGFVGNDSGLLHVADGSGVPSVGIFGPTSPGTTSPPSDTTESVYKNVECSPCSYRICPVDHKCMNRISVSEISEKVINLLKKGNGL